MKNVMMKIFALLLSVWYCLSIIGFDVHTCSAEGVSHVMTSFTSLDCETIHGHHHHEASEPCSCRTDGGVHIHAEKCCTDDYQVISLTGVRTDETHDHYDECRCGHCPCIDAAVSEALSVLASIDPEKYVIIPDSGLIVHEVHALFGIWRI